MAKGKDTTAKITDAELLQALYESDTTADAAARLGIAPVDLLRRAKHPRIQSQLRAINRAANEAIAARLIAASSDAVDVLHRLAKDSLCHASIRLGAAGKLADLKDRYVEQDLVRRELEEVRAELVRIQKERDAANGDPDEDTPAIGFGVTQDEDAPTGAQAKRKG